MADMIPDKSEETIHREIILHFTHNINVKTH